MKPDLEQSETFSSGSKTATTTIEAAFEPVRNGSYASHGDQSKNLRYRTKNHATSCHEIDIPAAMSEFCLSPPISPAPSANHASSPSSPCSQTSIDTIVKGYAICSYGHNSGDHKSNSTSNNTSIGSSSNGGLQIAGSNTNEELFNMNLENDNSDSKFSNRKGITIANISASGLLPLPVPPAFAAPPRPNCNNYAFTSSNNTAVPLLNPTFALSKTVKLGNSSHVPSSKQGHPPTTLNSATIPPSYTSASRSLFAASMPVFTEIALHENASSSIARAQNLYRLKTVHISELRAELKQLQENISQICTQIREQRAKVGHFRDIQTRCNYDLRVLNWKRCELEKALADASEKLDRAQDAWLDGTVSE